MAEQSGASPVQEALESAAVLHPREDWGTLLVRGPERLSWLNGLVTCDVKELGASQANWGLALDRRGKIQSEVCLLEQGDHTLVGVSPATAPELQQHLDRMLIMEDAELSDASAEYLWFCLWGPRALSSARELAPAGSVVAPLDRLGLGGAVLAVAERDGRALLEAWGGRPILSAEQWLSLRLERAVPEYGVDFTQDDRPHEASLERLAVSWSKGCYLGQEVVCMQDMRGKVKRHLALFSVQGPGLVVPAPGSSVLSEQGEPVGRITSAAPSLQRDRVLALLSVRTDADNTPLTVAGGNLRLEPYGRVE
jgi:tRNA-modifying protein YgfZ